MQGLSSCKPEKAGACCAPPVDQARTLGTGPTPKEGNMATKRKPQTSQDVATVKGPQVPASVEAAFDTEDTGFENVQASDLIIPRYSILQGLSPQVTKGKPEYD